MSEPAFSGFPAIGRATAVPNTFFSLIAPKLRAPGELLAFLWVARTVQQQRGEVCFASAAELWEDEACAQAFSAFGGGQSGLESGLVRCAELGALLGVELLGPEGAETVYFINNPGSRRAVARARAGELELRPRTVVRQIQVEARPGIFRLYEDHVGTITPIVAERLLAAAEEYPWEWIEDAFRESAELNKRNWRYIERILQNMAQEGRYEATGRTAGEPPIGAGTGGYVARRR